MVYKMLNQIHSRIFVFQYSLIESDVARIHKAMSYYESEISFQCSRNVMHIYHVLCTHCKIHIVSLHARKSHIDHAFRCTNVCIKKDEIGFLKYI